MSYTRNTNFTAKDLLAPGAEGKTILGEEIQIELDEIAACMANLPNANDGALTGTTTAVDLDVSGDLSVGGTLTVGGDVVTATGTELNNTTGSTSNIQDQLDALSANSGSATNVSPHRYWRLKLTTSANLAVRELRFWTNGSGFSNGLRWSPGILLDNATLAPTVSTGPDSSGGTLGSASSLVDGSTATTASLTKSGAGDFSADIKIDFGVSSQALSSIQLVMQTATDVISAFEILFSDNDSTWTSVGTFDASDWTAAITDNVASPHFAITYASTSTSSDYAVTSSDVETIPVVTGGGGGASFWTFDPTIRTSNLFFPAAGTYYMLNAAGGTFNIVLDNRYSDGDVIGFTIINGTSFVGLVADDGSSTTVYGGSAYYIGDASALVRHVSLVYDASADNFEVFAGGINTGV